LPKPLDHALTKPREQQKKARKCIPQHFKYKTDRKHNYKSEKREASTLQPEIQVNIRGTEVKVTGDQRRTTTVTGDRRWLDTTIIVDIKVNAICGPPQPAKVEVGGIIYPIRSGLPKSAYAT
jgi:hypothetical protein